MSFQLSAEYKTSPNIAVIKYWGKLHENLILPLNTSLGFTLNTDDLCTITKVVLSTENKKDNLILNGKEFEINKRLQRILDRFRQDHLEALINKINSENPNLNLQKEQFQYFDITSVNDFPTASGLASSASGLAAISVCLCDIFQVPEKLSEIARLGSGSACRSVYGGLVQWSGPGKKILQENFYNNNLRELNGLDEQNLVQLSQNCVSQAILQNKKADFFDKTKILIFCANFTAKEVPSTGGMLQSTKSSDYLQYRTTQIVDQNIEAIVNAIQSNDFDKFADITIKDSNQFHSVCLDTTPPIFYLNEFSKLIISVVEKLNSSLDKEKGLKNKIAYTYDAGPHAVLFIQEESFEVVFRIFSQIFGFSEEMLNKKGQNSLKSIENNNGNFKEIVEYFREKVCQAPSYVIQTDVGNGPEKI